MFPSRPLLVATLCSLLFACQQGKEEHSFVLNIAHMNDTHSQFDPVNATISNPALNVDGNKQGDTLYTRFGGYPRLLTMTKAMQADAQRQNQALLTLHGGDAWQGSGYFKLNEGMANADLLSQFGLDAMALGNHEFDLTNQKLARFIKAVNFPVLAANVDTSQDPDLKAATNLKPYVLFAFDGNQKTPVANLENLPAGKQIVAVVGLVLEDMPDIAPNTGKLHFAKEVATAQATIDNLKAHGVNKVVLLTHIGNQRDLDLAAKVNGIDVIVGGHSHSLLGDFSNLGMGKSATQYAQMVTNPDGVGETCVVQAGAYAEAMGEVKVTFNGQGAVTECEGNNTLLASNDFYSDAAHQHPLGDDQHNKVTSFIDQQHNIERVDEDARLRGVIDSNYKPALEKAFGKVIASVPADLANPRRPGDDKSDEHGSDVAPLVAESQYWWSNSAPVQAVIGKPVDIAITAVGGVRASIAAGEWREGDAALTLLPFKNQMSVLSLKGSDLRALISETVTATLPSGSHAGKFPYASHLRYTFQETEAGKAGKLTQLEWLNHNGQWQALEDDVRYRVAMNAYCANGNDGWDAVYRAQQQPGAERVDLALVNGTLTAFPVTALQREGDKAIASYQGQALDCKADGVGCGTDAAAFTDYVRSARSQLTALPDETVTLLRHP